MEVTHIAEPGHSLRPRVGVHLALQVDVVPLLDLLQPHGGAQPQPGRADEVDVEGAGGLNGGVRQSGDSGSAGDRLPVVVGLCQEGDGAGGQVVVVAGLQPGLQHVDQAVPQSPGDAGRWPGAHSSTLQGISLPRHQAVSQSSQLHCLWSN